MKTINRRWWMLVRSIADGRFYGIPWCCVLRWSITSALWPSQLQARERDGRFHDPVSPDPRRVYVPCLWFHKSHEKGPQADDLAP